MKTMRQRKYLFALLALLLVFAACKGESPTAPAPTTPGGGGTTPPTGATVTLTVSNANPLVNSRSVITATVTLNNAPVPNGTAVEFTVNDPGKFEDTGTSSTIRTTTNGVATASLTSATAGAFTVVAVVNNVTKSTVINFKAVDVIPCPPNCVPVDTKPTITSISPTVGTPNGTPLVTITGTNFRTPLRVIFDFGGGVTKDAFVVSSTATQIVVTAPSVDLGTGQTKSATIQVIVGAGTSTEQSVTAGTPFVFQAEVLTPSITTLSPSSGPIDGGTRVTIFGDAFQAPVQVFFGSAQAQVITVTFKEITVMSPAGRDTNPDGSGTVTGPVEVKVINITSAKTATLAAAFRYTPKMQITAAGPTQGDSKGGTKIVIDGIGFNDPVTVTVAGVAAQPIKITGTQVTAITNPPLLTSCANVVGPIVVTNIDNGDQASGPAFTFVVNKPQIVNISSSSATAGNSLDVTVADALPGPTRIQIGDQTAFITAVTQNSNGTTTFTVTIPLNLTFPTGPCTTSGGLQGTGPVPALFDITYTSLQSGCTDTVKNAVRVSPASAVCNLPPQASITNINPNLAGCLNPPTAGVTIAPLTTTGTITISNAPAPSGTTVAPLNVTSVTITGTNAAEFSVAPISRSNIISGTSQVFTVTFDPTTVGAKNATVTFATNDPANPTLTTCVVATAGP